jgi:hypothetical protein
MEPLEPGRLTEPVRETLFPKRPTVRVDEGAVMVAPRAPPVRVAFARGWRTIAVSERERGAVLVSVGLLCDRAAVG